MTLAFGAFRDTEVVPESGRSIFHALKLIQGISERAFSCLLNEPMQTPENYQITYSL